MRTISPGGVHEMEILLNDLSVHGQFQNIQDFRESVHRIMELRQAVGTKDRQLYVRKDILNRPAVATESMFNTLHKLSRDEKISVLGWIEKNGPFWTVAHDPNLWLWHGSEIVTDTAVGEAAYHVMLGEDRWLVSFTPSDWEHSPIMVMAGPSADAIAGDVPNYLQVTELEIALRQSEPSITSWEQMETRARSRFPRLTFSNDCCRHLDGQPFAPSAAKQIISRLKVLNQLMGEVDGGGNRTPEGHRLYQSHFTGDRAWFSDSSDTEKNDFKQQLTFPNPEEPGQYLFCPWHGKINNPPFRIHFAWPFRPGAPLFVAYIGLKITRR